MQPQPKQQRADEEAHQFLQRNSQPFTLLPPGVGMQSEAGQILPPGMQPMPLMPAVEPMDIDSENELFSGAAAAATAAGASLAAVDEGAEADRSREGTSLSPFRAWAEAEHDDAAAAGTEDADTREKPRNFTSFFLNPSHFNPRSELLHTVNAEGDTVSSSASATASDKLPLHTSS